MKKDELLARIHDDRERLDAGVARVDAGRLAEPLLEGGWSIKDVLAHVSFWERTCAGWLAAVARGETPERPEVRDVDATNARAFADARGLPLDQVQEAARVAYAAIVDATRALSGAELADESRFGFPLWRMIDGNSADHYREHADQIEAWLAATTP
jgi:hypothetical protein